MDPITLTTILALFKAKAWIPLLVLAITALVNMLFKLKTPEAWDELAESYPRIHALCDFLRRLGIQPIEAFEALERIVSGAKPPPTDPPSTVSPSLAAPTLADSFTSWPPLKLLNRIRMGWRGVKTGSILLVAGLFLAGCASWFTPAHASDLLVIGQCIDAHINESIPQIALDCGIQDEKEIQDLTKLVAAKRTALAAVREEGFSAGVQAGRASK